MTIKRLIALLILSATIFSMFGCDAIKNGGGHKTPDETDNTETPENQVITYVYSVSSGSFHLEGCSYISEIKEKYLKTTDDITYLLEEGYEPCRKCFPPAEEPEPEEEEEPSVPKEQATFVINKKSNKMHYVDCYIVKEMDSSNVRYTDLSLEQLLEDECVPCGHCMPEQYEQYKKDHPDLFPEKD